MLPFTYSWIIKRQLGNLKTVLDLGCSDGNLMVLLNKDKRCSVVGVDIYKPDLIKAKKTGAYKNLIHADIRNYHTRNKFDVVLSSQVIEHLDKKDGERLIKNMEIIAKDRVIIGTTVGFLPYEPLQGDDSGNEFQKHRSGWEVEDFEKLGYRVYGQGTRYFYQENGIIRKMPAFMSGAMYLLSYLFSPLNYWFPKSFAYLQIAVKNL